MAPKPKSAAKSSSDFFTAGSKVEVSSDDDGFRGSWFSGTIVRRTASDMFLVEYDNLLADEQGKKRLRETLKLNQLRPLPPQETPREFKFGDEVDAFHNDGWWEGHITGILGNGKYTVYFRASREQIEFSKENLRRHREWLNENWDPPFEQQEQQQPPPPQPRHHQRQEKVLTPNVKSNETVKEKEKEKGERFSIGKLVEVSSDEDGFQGAWFSATVVQLVGKDKFLVEYQTLLDDDSQLLKEEVDIMHIRPHPPETCATGEFTLLQEVDALHNDGWWVGVISKVLGNSRYIVYFRNSNEELEFQHSQLRLHQDWMNGKWFIASKALKL